MIRNDIRPPRRTPVQQKPERAVSAERPENMAAPQPAPPIRDKATEAPQGGRLRWLVLIVLSLALAIIIIDTTLLNVSLSAIIRDLNTDIQSIQWVISGYSLTLAALTITGGRFGDLFGRKRMFVLGAIIFAIGSFITSISTTIPVMIAGEAIIEGIGAALMMPATSSLLVATFKGRERAIAFGIWGAIAAGSAALGPVLGGYLTTNYSWRYGFRINILVALVLVIGSFLIKESRNTEEKPTIDWIGVLLSSTGLLAFIFGVIESSQYGWWTAKQIFTLGSTPIEIVSGISIVPFALLLGACLLFLFALWEMYVDDRGGTPLVSMRLFSNQQFTSGVLTTMVLSLGQSGLIFSIPVFLQSVRKLDAYHTGIALLPMSVALLIVAPLSAYLSGKIVPKYLIQTGLLMSVAAYVVLRFSFSVDADVSSFIPGLLLYGAGLGLVMSQINNLTLSAVSVQEAGEASGVSNTMRQIGASLGSAIIGAVLLSALSFNLATNVQASTVIPDSMKNTLATTLSEQTSNVEFGAARQQADTQPSYITDEVSAIGKQSIVDANKTSLIYGAIFAFLGFLVSFWLPNVRNLEKNQSAAKH
jgi:EmrB/QacA subfamily drug resistance transporter